MKTQYLSDYFVTFAIQGLRWVSKEDKQAWGSLPESYSLELVYKGEKKTVDYSEKSLRDAMYERAVAALSGDKK